MQRQHISLSELWQGSLAVIKHLIPTDLPTQSSSRNEQADLPHKFCLYCHSGIASAHRQRQDSKCRVVISRRHKSRRR